MVFSWNILYQLYFFSWKKIFYFFFGQYLNIPGIFFFTKKKYFWSFFRSVIQNFPGKNILQKKVKIFQELFIFFGKKYQLGFWSFFGLFMEFCWSFGIFCGIFLKYLLEYYSRFYSNKSQTLYHEYPWNIPSVKKYTWNILFIHEKIPGIILVFGASQTTNYQDPFCLSHRKWRFAQ